MLLKGRTLAIGLQLSREEFEGSLAINGFTQRVGRAGLQALGNVAGLGSTIDLNTDDYVVITLEPLLVVQGDTLMNCKPK